MRAILSIAVETFLRLRRDKIFLPAALIGLGLLSLSGLASYWGVEEFFKILYDLGTAAYLFTGATVAIFWGHKIISDSRQEGSLEVQLASPVSRSAWLIGKFLGLMAGLLIMSGIFLVGWQGIYSAYGMGWMPTKDVIIFLVLGLSWLVMGAVSILFASLASGAIALFCSIWVFIVGLLSAPVMQALSPETPASTRKLVEIITGIWNLHLFNLSSYGSAKQFVGTQDILSRCGYGFLLVACFIALACLFFERRDIVA
ncbi:MAG: ABC transporter permease subunit [Oligoflexus sp.]|jgi:Cu-processing system permease protein